MGKTAINLQKYWDDRLSSNLNLRGTGHRAFNLQYNEYLYQAQADCLTKLLDKWDINLANKKLLDIGSGTGYYIDYYKKRNASGVSGLDLSKTSVDYLKSKYPEFNFHVEDISGPSLEYLGTFDFISAISVIYHVIDNRKFSQTLINLSVLCKPGGYLLISDAFTKSWSLSAQHAHLRSLEEYQLSKYNYKVIDISPIYYLLNRTFIPILGPKIINGLNLGYFFYGFDQRLREKGWKNGSGMKFMLAQKIL
jgi:2-polyprenyl-3-methyl-5-hydroxy-6-metoxy-1,4-benzoquinol methylase